jgi:uncharacterized protein YjbI with pentapeptide repeats/uncharacterized membrane protein
MRMILEYIKVHYNQCMKNYLYLGISFVCFAVFLRISFWAIYTTETADIEYDDEDQLYPEIEPGDTIRIHGDIDELEYYGEIDQDIPDRENYQKRDFNLRSGIYLHGLQVVDNITLEEELYQNTTLTNTLLYDGEITKVEFVNVTFENVSFIKSSFSRVRFIDVDFSNVSIIDTTFRECEFTRVIFSHGYCREMDITESILRDTDLESMSFSRTVIKRIDWIESTFTATRFNDTAFTGVRFLSPDWDRCTFYNNSFDVVVLAGLNLKDSSFQMTTFMNIFEDNDSGLDHTFIRSSGVHIRVNEDFRNAFTEDTSFYGNYEIIVEIGTIESESGENIEYSYEVFINKDTHHSLRIDGIFYIIILGGFTVVTYSYGGKAVIMTLVKFFMPFVFSSIGILVLFLALPWDTFEKLGTWMILYFFPPLGKESVIPAAIAQGIHPLLIASAVAFIDIMVGLFLVWNFDLARKIPLIGKFIRRIESKGNEILAKKPWVERLAFTGIILFVMFPFQGSGAVGATIVGRMLGMDPRKVWYAVIIGAIVGCLIIAYTSAFAMTFLLGIGVAWALITVALVVIFLILAYNYDKWGDWVKEVREHLDHLEHPKE